MVSENKSTMCYSNIAEYSVRYVDYRTWYNSDAHEAIHPPTMYYCRTANDLQQ